MLKKIILAFLGLVILAITVFVLTVNIRYDRTFEAPYPEITAVEDSAAIARGKYLVYGPAHCAHCHSPMDEREKLDNGELVSLSGGFDFILPIGTIHAPNITTDVETGIGSYTDGEIARALRYGIKRNGRAMIDFMPFYDISNDDLLAILSFLRSQDPVKNIRPSNDFNIIGKAVMSFVIEPSGDGIVPSSPPADTTASYGNYLVNSVANCAGCHSKRDMMTGNYIGPKLAGGQPFEALGADFKIRPDKHFITPNLTPDKSGVIAGWSKDAFIQRFRTGSTFLGSPMPWGSFKTMPDTELIAIYKYLTSLKPVENIVPVGLQDGPPQ